MMSRHQLAYPAFAVLLPAAALLGWRRAEPPPTEHRTEVVSPEVPAPGVRRELRLVTADEGNAVRYRVREQLARIEFPSDAVGETGAVTGTIVIADDGTIAPAESKFVVDLRGLKSDSDMRDGFIQHRTLETEEYPLVEFAPRSIAGLATPPQSTGELNLTVTGDMTVHGTTRPVTWEVTARADDGVFTGTATTAVTFEDFGLTKPRVARVLSVVDTIRLEYDFLLVSGDR